MSFQPLHNFAGSDVESLSATSSHQLVGIQSQQSRNIRESKRKTLLAVAIFSLIVFIASLVGYGIFCLQTSHFDTDEVAVAGTSANRVSTYAAKALPDPKPEVRPRKTTSTRPPKHHADVDKSTPTPPPPSSANKKDPNHPNLDEPQGNSTKAPISTTPSSLTPSTKPSAAEEKSVETGTVDHDHDEASQEEVEEEDGDGQISSKTKRSRNSNRRRVTPTLPPNPMEKNPVSLLYEMDLSPKFEFFVCPTNIQKYKAVVTIEAQDSKTYLGYGVGKRNSKRMAAQLAATDIYKPRINYTDLPSEAQVQELATNCGITS